MPIDSSKYTYRHQTLDEIYKVYRKHSPETPRCFFLTNACNAEDLIENKEYLEPAWRQLITLTSVSCWNNMQKAWFIDRVQLFYSPRGSIYWFEWKPLLCPFCNIEFIMNRRLFWNYVKTREPLMPHAFMCQVCRIEFETEIRRQKKLKDEVFYFGEWDEVTRSLLHMKGLWDVSRDEPDQEWFNLHKNYSRMVSRDGSKYLEDNWQDYTAEEVIGNTHSPWSWREMTHDFSPGKVIKSFKVPYATYPPIVYLIDPAEKIPKWQYTPALAAKVRQEVREQFSIQPMQEPEGMEEIVIPPIPENFASDLLKATGDSKSEQRVIEEFLAKNNMINGDNGVILTTNADIPGKCSECGKAIELTRKTCSQKCKQERYRKNRKEEN